MLELENYLCVYVYLNNSCNRTKIEGEKKNESAKANAHQALETAGIEPRIHLERGGGGEKTASKTSQQSVEPRILLGEKGKKKPDSGSAYTNAHQVVQTRALSDGYISKINIIFVICLLFENII